MKTCILNNIVAFFAFLFISTPIFAQQDPDHWLPIFSSTWTPGILWHPGVIGIGTKSPQDILHIHGISTQWPFAALRISSTIASVSPGGYDCLATSQIAMSHTLGAFSNIATAGDLVIRTISSTDATLGGCGEDIIVSTQTPSGVIRFATWDNTFHNDTEKMTIHNDQINGELITLSSGNDNVGDQQIHFKQFGFGITCHERGSIVQYSRDNENGDYVMLNNRANNDPNQADQLLVTQKKGMRFFMGNQQEQVRFTPDGQVLIGVDFPTFDMLSPTDPTWMNINSFKLAVKGKIKAGEIVVSTQQWPDFVFDRNYSLPSLASVEKHIQEHRHLPGIPSAKEVEEQGISVGDMQAKLLQKMEELTLYMIDMKKENEAMKTENENLMRNLEDIQAHLIHK